MTADGLNDFLRCVAGDVGLQRRLRVSDARAAAGLVGCVKFFGQVLWCFQAAVAVLWWSARACAGVR